MIKKQITLVFSIFIASLFLFSCDDISFLYNQNNDLLIGEWQTTEPFEKKDPDDNQIYKISEILTFNKDYSFTRLEKIEDTNKEPWIQKGSYQFGLNTLQSENFQGIVVINYHFDNSNYVHENHFYFSFIEELDKEGNKVKSPLLQLVNEIGDKEGKTYRKLESSKN